MDWNGRYASTNLNMVYSEGVKETGMRSFTQDWVAWISNLAQLLEKQDFGQGRGHPLQTCAWQADKGVFRKVMNGRVGLRWEAETEREGRGSLFPPGRWAKKISLISDKAAKAH